MKIFQCNQCFHPIFFENTVCEKCGASLGYLSRQHVLSTLVEKEGAWKALASPGVLFRYCKNHDHNVCNWLVPATGDKERCTACALNGTIPNLDNSNNLKSWQKLEFAKHRLVYSILRLGLPLENKSEAPETGLSFNFLSDDRANQEQNGVLTGHAQGLITINIAEADAAHREQTREEMAEPYRTLIGHFRHEIGHYYWDRLVKTNSATLLAFRELFGDERANYSEALQHYHEIGPPDDWPERFVSAYSSSHPWEEWAETWAHYFHLVDTLETAYTFGISINPNLHDQNRLNMQADVNPYAQPDFDAIIAAWLPLTFAINSLNRSMGQPDLYPFVLPPPVIEKLRFIHQLLQNIKSVSESPAL
jgi:hypothetical protein